MDVLKFYPLQSSISPGFWSSLTRYKLEVARLNEEPLSAWGSFTASDPPEAKMTPRLSMDWDAFQETPQQSWNQFSVKGEILMTNTIEAFKQADKGAFIRNHGTKIWQSIVDGEFWEQPNILARFSVLLHGDLKKYIFYYWFAFPSFNLPTSISVETSTNLSQAISQEQLNSLEEGFKDFIQRCPGSMYSVARVQIADNSVEFLPLQQLQHVQQADDVRLFICVADPCSNGEHPGWPVRNLVVALAANSPHLLTSTEILCLRIYAKEGKLNAGHSLVLKLKSPIEKLTEMPGVVGWEKNDKGQLAPRVVNMKSSMDPKKIAESSVDLNLKLMKWRLVPDLQLDKVSNSKYLLLGSGTLGCNIARNLLGWGARTITFVDNAKVSFSNPVRQSLYEFADCLDGGKSKAKAAAAKCRQIFPGVTSEGYDLAIPMPGHPVSKSVEFEVKKAYELLTDLIKEHDVIFLLMDSRESRWLPTLIAACYPEKLVITAALGFDTYLVMRHGVRLDDNVKEEPSAQGKASMLRGDQLGCYFCNDVVAPGDSLSDRTLDMQCTVTRSGTSSVAGALAVELTVNCLQHPKGPKAPAPVSQASESDSSELDGILGSVPHSIRGSVGGFDMFKPTSPEFNQCTACSKPVRDLLKAEGFELVRKVGDNPKFLEDTTGITSLIDQINISEDILGFDADDISSIDESI